MKLIAQRGVTFLFELVANVLVWFGHRFLRSHTGRNNPRVRSVTRLGYFLRGYELLRPNIKRWLRTRGEIFPAIVQVQTVNRCNAACKMCPYPYTVHIEPRQVMSATLWEKIANECAAEPDLKVLVPMSKNEPLMDKHLEERIAFFRRSAQPHQQVELVTNGTMLDAERFTKLRDSGLDLVTISMNATTEETHRMTMPGVAWERVQRNMAEVAHSEAAQDVNIFVRFIEQRDNSAETADFHTTWQQTGLNTLSYEINNRSGTVRDYDSLVPPESAAQQRRDGFRRALRDTIFPLCPYAFSYAHVLANGDVPLCANDWHNHEILGNLNEQSLRQVFNSPRAQEIREMMAEGRYAELSPCKDCTLWKEAKWM